MLRCKFLFLWAILAGIAMCGLAPPARADFEVQFSYGGATILIDGTTQSVSVSGGAAMPAAGSIDFSTPGTITINSLTISPNGTTGGFAVSATIADSNSPGANNIASIDLSSLSIKNKTGITGNSTLTITSGDTGFTQPTSPPAVLLASTISATAAGTNSHSATVTFNSYLDTTNQQFGEGQGTPTIALGPITAGNSASGNSLAYLSGTPIPYSLTEVETVTLANGDKLTDGSSGTTATAPAPTGLSLALSGLPVLGVFYLRRRLVLLRG